MLDITAAYDYRSRPLRVESPLDPGVHAAGASVAAATFSYDGYEITVTDADGGRKTEKGDYLGRIRTVTEYIEGLPYDTLYAYAAAGDLTIVQNKIGVQTQFGYDTLGRRISMIDPDLGDLSYTYDENGNLKTQTDAKNQVITFDYDALNRVTSKTYATGDPTVTYTYDNTGAGANGIGRLHAVSNTAAATTYDAYDETGRELSVTQSIDGAPKAAYTTTNTYDPAGKLLTMTYPDVYQIHHTYFAGSELLNTVTGPAPDFEAHAELDTYRPAGQIGSIYFGNGAATAYGYDAKSSRLTSIATIDPVLSTLLDKSYTYSAAGDVNTMTDHKGITYTYSYDSLHRLISETNDGPAESFAEVVIENTYTDDFRPFHAPSSVNFNGGDYPYGYDANGNTAVMHNFNDPANVREQTITYNADNMPKQIEWVTFSGGSAMSWTVDFDYDGQSRRVKKTRSWGSETFHIGNHFEIENGTEVKYIFAGNQRVAKVTAAGTHFFHKDHLGSSNVVTDYANGAAVETTEYMPFGQTREQTGNTISSYKFTDQELDPSTGLYNYDARLYDPVVGRFIAADSIIPNLYDPQLLNRYGYVRNNPLKYVDPDGHVLETAWDVANIGIGIYSFASNVASGNWGSAALDAGGVIVDVAATAVPFIPGGAGTAIKVARAADKTVDAVKKIDKAVDTANIARKSEKIADVSKKPKVDFLATEDGVAIHKSQSRMKKSFDDAGFSSSTTRGSNVEPAGTSYQVPTKHGDTEVRLMPGNADRPRRAVFTKPGTKQYTNIDGSSLDTGYTRPLTKDQRRSIGHLNQDP